MSIFAIIVFLFWTLTSLGMIFDKSPLSWINEFIRSGTFMLIYFKIGAWNEFRIPVQILYAAFVGSMAISAVAMGAQAFNSTKTMSKQKAN